MAVTRQLSPTLDEVEDAILAALKADTTIAGYARSIATFQGSLVKAVQQGIGLRQPALLVLFNGGPLKRLGSGLFRLTAEWDVLCCARNLRSAAHGANPEASGEVGAYDIVADVLRVLSDTDLDLDGMDDLVPLDIELLSNGEIKDATLTVYRVIFRGDVELQVVEPDQLLEEIVATFDAANTDEDTGDTEWSEDVLSANITLES